MFFGDLAHSSRAEALHPLLKQLFEYVKSLDLTKPIEGVVHIAGDDLYIREANPDGKAQDAAKVEGHELYTDVHIVLEGTETIGIEFRGDDSQPIDHYNAEKDFQLFARRPDAYIKMLPGQFAITFPEDLHAPVIGEGKIRKIIAKVKI